MNEYSRMLTKASQFLWRHNHFLVVSHLNPDGDATSSSLAVAHLLTKLGKKYVVANEGPTSHRFDFLNGFEQIVNLSHSSFKEPFHSVITVDAADYERLGDVSHLLSDSARILNIDHHATNTLFGEVNLIQPTAASTTEVLYDLMHHHFKGYMDDDIAQCLYTGLLTDTGGFRYSNTNQRVLLIAAELLRYSIDPAEMAESALETISVAHLRLLKESLDSLTLAFNQKVAMISVSLKTMEQSGATEDDINGLVSYPRKIEGVQVGVLFKERKHDEVKVSLRSRDPYIDVAHMAQKYGGGGHTKAAGYTYKGTLEEAKSCLMQDLAKELKE